MTLAVSACTGGGAISPTTSPAPTPLPPTPSPQGSLALVGHSRLYGRGMNAGLAVQGDYAYVGNRTDGYKSHVHPGVLVVSIRDPARPRIVGEIGPPEEGNPGETSRELRIWPAQHLLLVLNFGCDPFIHDCAGGFVRPTIRFYDISDAFADRPRLVSTYKPSETPHEFFLWQDPSHAGRALLYMSTPGAPDTVLITDISRAREGKFEEVASWGADFPDPGPDDNLHSLSVSYDGRLAYLAHLTRGFFMIDTSEVARGDANPEIRLATPIDRRLEWKGWGAHSAVRIPGRDLVLTTDEVYGSDEPGGGCPWGWARIIDGGSLRVPRLAVQRPRQVRSDRRGTGSPFELLFAQPHGHGAPGLRRLAQRRTPGVHDRRPFSPHSGCGVRPRAAAPGGYRGPGAELWPR